MDLDRILGTLNRHRVDYLLIGGMDFLLRHQPVITLDVDLWLDDTPDNRGRGEAALTELGAEWGPAAADWGPVARRAAGWLGAQPLFCLTTAAGPLDVFRAVPGLAVWGEAAARAVAVRTAAGTGCRGLSDADLLACQYALPEGERKLDRIRYLEQVLAKQGKA